VAVRRLISEHAEGFVMPGMRDAVKISLYGFQPGGHPVTR
jgi:hypothetical protein